MGLGILRMRFGEVGSRQSAKPSSAAQWRLAIALPVVALLLAGCSGMGSGGGGNEGPMGAGNAGGQGLFGSTMETTTVLTNDRASPNSPSNINGGGPVDTSNFACPRVEVRGGAAAWQVTDKADGGVRYQATLGQFSRECHYTSPNMTMRVGIQGRVLLGAKGGPGKLNVPIRLAVVEEGPVPKPVWTKFYSVPVEIGAGVMQVDFGLVADDIAFPLPSAGSIERYIVYVGFDSQAGTVAETKPAARPKPVQQARPRPVQAAPVVTAPVQSAPVAVQPAPVQPRAVPTQAVTPAPATPAPVVARPAAPANPPPLNDSQTQWIGAPAPNAGGFSQ